MIDKEIKITEFFSSFSNREEYFQLMYYFFTDFRYKDTWEKTIFPMLESIRNDEIFGVDWTDFVWGAVCFRKNHVMFLDESIHQVGRRFPPLLDENNDARIDELGQWLENTEYIEQHYTEFFKISFDEFVLVCEKWYREVLSS